METRTFSFHFIHFFFPCKKKKELYIFMFFSKTTFTNVEIQFFFFVYQNNIPSLLCAYILIRKIRQEIEENLPFVIAELSILLFEQHLLILTTVTNFSKSLLNCFLLISINLICFVRITTSSKKSEKFS